MKPAPMSIRAKVCAACSTRAKSRIWWKRWTNISRTVIAANLLNAAFQLFEVESELDEQRLRLAPTDQDIGESADQLFALPLIGDEETGAYYELLDAITAARIRKLNATHHYVRACTDLEMQEELDALDRDRYFASENIHCFDEINEILQWSPAEWDDSSSI